MEEEEVRSAGSLEDNSDLANSFSTNADKAIPMEVACSDRGERPHQPSPVSESFFDVSDGNVMKDNGNDCEVNAADMASEENITLASAVDACRALPPNFSSPEDHSTSKLANLSSRGTLQKTMSDDEMDQPQLKISSSGDESSASSDVESVPSTQPGQTSQPIANEGETGSEDKQPDLNSGSVESSDQDPELRNESCKDREKLEVSHDNLKKSAEGLESEERELRIVVKKLADVNGSEAEKGKSDSGDEIREVEDDNGETDEPQADSPVTDDEGEKMYASDWDADSYDSSSDEAAKGAAGRRKRRRTAAHQSSFPMISLPVETVIKLEPREWIDDPPDDADRDPDWAPEHGLWHPGCHSDLKQEHDELYFASDPGQSEDTTPLASTSKKDRGRKRKKKLVAPAVPRKSRTTEFECDMCDKKYKIITNLQKHQRVAHPPPKPSNPDEALSKFRQRPQSGRPQRKVPAKAVYSCPQCDQKFLDKMLRDQHALTHEAESPAAESTSAKAQKAQSEAASSSCEAPLPKEPVPTAPSSSEVKTVTSKPSNLPKKKRNRGNKIFICLYCGKKFGRKDHRDKHHRTHRGEEPIYSDPPPGPKGKKDKVYNCDKCEKTFMRKDHCNKHMLTHTGEKLFSCEICGKMLSRKDHLVRHVRNHEADGERRPRPFRPHTPVECEICGRAFQFAAHLTKHSETPHTKEEPWDCFDCRKIFSTKTALRNHRLIHNDENALDCEDCGKVFLEPEKLEKHRLSAHLDQTVSFECDVCNKVFPRRDKLKRHVMTKHTAQVFQCEQCGESFPKQASLEAHMVEHMGDDAHQCKYCLKKFFRRHKMLKHQEKHTALKRFQCETCGKAFLRKESLRLHRLVHTGGAFKCRAEGCEKSFPREKDLDRHFLHVHTDIRPYECEKCGKRFATMRHKQEHQKLIRCDAVRCFCGAVFSRLGYMKLHQRQEHGMGDPLFPCEICGKQFLNKGSLGNHYPVHSGKKEWKCDECPKSFTWKGALTRHMRLHVRDAEMAAAKDMEAAAMVAANFSRAKRLRKSSSLGSVRTAMSSNTEEMNTTLESIGESLVKRAAESTSMASKSSVSSSSGSGTAAAAEPVSAEAQSAVTSAIQGAVNAAIQGAGEAATQRAMTAAIQGAVVAAIQGAGPEATQGAVTTAIQGAVTAAIQGAVAAAIQGAVTAATAGSAASQLVDENERDVRDDAGGQSSAWNLATSTAHSPAAHGMDASSQSSVSQEPGLVAAHPAWSQTIQSIGYQAMQSAGYAPPQFEQRAAPALLPLVPPEGRAAVIQDGRDLVQDGRGPPPPGMFAAAPHGATPWWHAGGVWHGH